MDKMCKYSIDTDMDIAIGRGRDISIDIGTV